ncbi:MAG: hypothetical protein JWO31_428, partial [Phycisphaerales bacterium]|nr:hypothetical protein [Phycisphaerales bacterium]
MTLPTPRTAGLRSAARMLATAAALGGAMACVGLATTGCSTDIKAPAPTTRYSVLPAAVNLPAFMEGTIEDRALITPESQQPMNVS